MNKNFKNAEVKGNRLLITREELMLNLEACIAIQTESKTQNDFTQWLIAAGYIEAIKDLLSLFEDNAN